LDYGLYNGGVLGRGVLSSINSYRNRLSPTDFWSCCHCCQALDDCNMLKDSLFAQMLKVTANKK